jgi:predicted DNA-binding transcriptional regulator AlpA
MHDIEPMEPRTSEPASDEMMTSLEACIFFGGEKRPLNLSTLYRGIKKGRYPYPVHVGPNISRWVRSECHAARQRLIDGERELRPPVGAGAKQQGCKTTYQASPAHALQGDKLAEGAVPGRRRKTEQAPHQAGA